MLRAVTRQQIFDIVENSYFGSGNYSIQFPGGESEIAFKVDFLPDSRFKFSAERISAGWFKTIEAPGFKLIEAAEGMFQGFDEALVRLEGWLERVQQEVITTNPFSREIQDLKAQLEEKLAALAEETSGFFTQAEAASLVDKLSEFERRLQDLVEQNVGLEQAVATLSKTVADLKEATQLINRGTWFRMAGGRLLGGLKLLTKSKEVREFALEAAKKFLLDAPK